MPLSQAICIIHADTVVYLKLLLRAGPRWRALPPQSDLPMHAFLLPSLFLSAVSSSINLIVGLPCLMVTSAAEALVLHVWWAWREKSKWPPALWWKPAQFECNRGSSIIQQSQRKTGWAVLSLEPHSVRLHWLNSSPRPWSRLSARGRTRGKQRSPTGVQADLWAVLLKGIENEHGEMWVLLSGHEANTEQFCCFL